MHYVHEYRFRILHYITFAYYFNGFGVPEEMVCLQEATVKNLEFYFRNLEYFK